MIASFTVGDALDLPAWGDHWKYHEVVSPEEAARRLDAFFGGVSADLEKAENVKRRKTMQGTPFGK